MRVWCRLSPFRPSDAKLPFAFFLSFFFLLQPSLFQRPRGCRRRPSFPLVALFFFFLSFFLLLPSFVFLFICLLSRRVSSSRSFSRWPLFPREKQHARDARDGWTQRAKRRRQFRSQPSVDKDTAGVIVSPRRHPWPFFHGLFLRLPTPPSPQPLGGSVFGIAVNFLVSSSVAVL